jgi:hypothetical protein
MNRVKLISYSEFIYFLLEGQINRAIIFLMSTNINENK